MNKIEKVILKEGQTIVDIHGNEHIVEKGDILHEGRMIESKMIEISNFNDLLRLPKNKLFSVENSVWFGGSGRHTFYKEDVYKVVKSTPTKISIQDSEGVTYYFSDLGNIYDLDTAKSLDSFYIELL